MTRTASLESSVRRGLLWSTLSNLLLRMGSLVLGICLARLLDPSQFGVYAVALTVQSVLMTLADLGLSATLIRSDDPDRDAPTVATLSLLTGAVLTGAMVLTAPALADLLGSPASTGPIQLLSLTLLLAGAGVVPYATLSRRFQQRELFLVAVTDFALSTVATLTLISCGAGVMALAAGRVTGQLAALVVQYRLAGLRPRVGLHPVSTRAVLRFGVPVATANLLSWALLSVDNVVIARGLGPVQLGLYVIAFNVSTWPMTAIGQVVRSVALPAFAQARQPDPAGRDLAFTRPFALVWALALPAGAFLALLAGPLVAVLYGARWAPAATVLGALGIFGAVRVVFDLSASYLLARGAARGTLLVQLCWLVSLVPAVVLGIRWDGLAGAGWAHVAVAVGVICPVYVVTLRRSGAAVGPLLGAVWPPVLAMVPAAAAVLLVRSTLSVPVLQLFAGGAAGVAAYASVLGRWFTRRLRHEPPEPAPSPAAPAPAASGSRPVLVPTPATDTWGPA